MAIALLIWGATIAFSLVCGTILCYKVEKSKVKRWGYSGKLFK